MNTPLWKAVLFVHCVAIAIGMLSMIAPDVEFRSWMIGVAIGLTVAANIVGAIKRRWQFIETGDEVKVGQAGERKHVRYYDESGKPWSGFLSEECDAENN